MPRATGAQRLVHLNDLQNQSGNIVDSATEWHVVSSNSFQHFSFELVPPMSNDSGEQLIVETAAGP